MHVGILYTYTNEVTSESVRKLFGRTSIGVRTVQGNGTFRKFSNTRPYRTEIKEQFDSFLPFDSSENVRRELLK